MQPETLEQPRDLSTIEMRQVTAQRFVLETGDVEFAAENRLEQCIVIGVEEIETGVGASLLHYGLR